MIERTEPAGRILIVDDSRTKRYVIGSWLRRAGHTVVEAENGADALLRLADGGVDGVVLDVNLPDMNGYQVCERIKTDPRFAALPVLQVSATAVDVADRALGLNLGADAYLAEPIDPDELVATMHAMLRYYRARQHAERLAYRLALLAETTLAVNAATTVEALLGAAASGAAAIFGGAATAAARTPDDQRLVAAVAEPGDEPTLRNWATESGHPILMAAAPGTVVRIPADGTWIDLPPWHGRSSEVWATVAQPKPNRPAAYVSVATPVTADEDEHILLQLGQAVAQAVEAIRSLDEERRIALTFQRSLLPREVPTVEGYDIAVRYEPASAAAAVGGDFYELAMLDDQLVVAIGDVVGHSLHAATVMAELRHALRAYVVERHAPHEVLCRLNDLMLRLIPDEIASVCLALLDPPTGRLRLASAGHMPPLLVAGGTVQLVDVAGPMLGIPANRPDDIELILPPGGILLLYTDGLVERRTESIDVGLGKLRRAASTVEDDLAAFTERVTRDLVGRGTDDDIALLVLRRRS